MDTHQIESLTKKIRVNILKMTHQIGSGHPTSSFSAVELMSVLFSRYFRFDIENPDDEINDRVIFSKGHASALLYALWEAFGAVESRDLSTYRHFNSPLEGHPTFRFKFSEAATGSLGQGLSIASGEAWAIRALFNNQLKNHIKPGFKSSVSENAITDSQLLHLPRIYVLMGDGELLEGSNWEAAAWASHQKLNNLVAIVDINRFGQAGETMYGYNLEIYRRRFEAFGWVAITIDGHDISQIDAAYEKALNYQGGPVAILSKTIKGKGISFWEDKAGWHNQMLPKDELDRALVSLGNFDKEVTGIIQKPQEKTFYQSDIFKKQNHKSYILNHKSYPVSEKAATKLALGRALVKIGKFVPNLIVLDGDVSNSLHTDLYRKSYPDRFLQMYIAESNMVGVGLGLSKRGFIPFINTFSAFLTRAHDQIRLIPLSEGTVLFNGSYAGVSVGRDGPSQEGLEDIALFRSIYGSTVLYPSDPYQTERLTAEMKNLQGVVYIRTTREPTPVIYGPEDEFPIGGSKLFKSKLKTNNQQLITIISAGITLHEALKAQKELEKEGIAVQVIDCYSIKPIDRRAIEEAARDSKAIVVVEDHYPEGGLGEAVRSALNDVIIPILHLAVSKLPMSGSSEELLSYEKLDSMNIINQIVKLHNE